MKNFSASGRRQDPVLGRPPNPRRRPNPVQDGGGGDGGERRPGSPPPAPQEDQQGPGMPQVWEVFLNHLAVFKIFIERFYGEYFIFCIINAQNTKQRTISILRQRRRGARVLGVVGGVLKIFLLPVYCFLTCFGYLSSWSMSFLPFLLSDTFALLQ